MKTALKKNLELLAKHRDQLEQTYFVKSIGIFGSVSKGLEKPQSDIDIVVEFTEPVGFFHFLDLKNYLYRTLGKKVDLVTKRALKPAIRKQVLHDTQYVGS